MQIVDLHLQTIQSDQDSLNTCSNEFSLINLLQVVGCYQALDSWTEKIPKGHEIPSAKNKGDQDNPLTYTMDAHLIKTRSSTCQSTDNNHLLCCNPSLNELALSWFASHRLFDRRNNHYDETKEFFDLC